MLWLAEHHFERHLRPPSSRHLAPRCRHTSRSTIGLRRRPDVAAHRERLAEQCPHRQHHRAGSWSARARHGILTSTTTRATARPTEGLRRTDRCREIMIKACTTPEHDHIGEVSGTSACRCCAQAVPENPSPPHFARAPATRRRFRMARGGTALPDNSRARGPRSGAWTSNRSRPSGERVRRTRPSRATSKNTWVWRNISLAETTTRSGSLAFPGLGGAARTFSRGNAQAGLQGAWPRPQA